MPKQKIIVKNVPDGIDGAPPWITTFVDMVSLLVTFFILLYTFSSIREFDTFTYPKNIMSTSGVIDGSASDTIEARTTISCWAWISRAVHASGTRVR